MSEDRIENREPSIEELVVKEEERIAASETGRAAARKEGMKIPGLLLGALIYSVGMNIFLRPLHLYSGGLLGFAQLVEMLWSDAGIGIKNVSISGIVYYLINLPIFIIAYKKIKRRFIIKTIISVSAVSFFLAFLPVPATPILDDTITLTILSGLICGAGTGIILLMGSSDGGTTLIGMLVIALKKKSSVGQINIWVNIVLYAIMLFLFDIPTVIYSLVFVVFSSIATDKIHTQNINSQMLIITKLKDTKPMEVEIMSRLYRGMTEIDASGTFTGDAVKVFIVFVSRYEVNRFKAIVQSHDPQAFIVETTNINIDGPFLKKVI